jgi:hypothetical protein
MPCDKAGNDTPWLPSPHGPLRQRLLPHPRGWAADSGWIGALLVGDREALTRHRTTGAVTSRTKTSEGVAIASPPYRMVMYHTAMDHLEAVYSPDTPSN